MNRQAGNQKQQDISTLAPQAGGILQRVAISAIKNEIGQPALALPTASTSRFGQDFSRVPLRSRPPAAIQPKLTVSQPEDAAEREADQVADAVVSGAQGGASAVASIVRPTHWAPAMPIAPAIQRQQEKVEESDGALTPVEEESANPQGGFAPSQRRQGASPENQEEETIQRKPISPLQADQAVANLDESALRAPGGSPIPEGARADFEPKFGADFSAVRIHADSRADALCKSVAARAFTHRNHIYFASQQYQPETSAGRRLLAHELAHTVQQGATQTLSGVGDVARPVQPRADSTSAMLQRAIDTSVLLSSFSVGALRTGAIPVAIGLPVVREMAAAAYAEFGNRNPPLDMRATDRWYYINPVFTNSIVTSRSWWAANVYIPNNGYWWADDTYNLTFSYAHKATRQRSGSFAVASGRSSTDTLTLTGGVKVTLGKVELSGQVENQRQTGTSSSTTVTATDFYEHDYDVALNYDISTTGPNDIVVRRDFFGPHIERVSGPHQLTGSVPVGSITLYDDDNNPDNLTP